MGLAFLVRAMETVGQALVDMRDSVDPRVTLEVALIRLVSPALDASPAAILERVERLERALSERTGPSAGPSSASHPPLPPSVRPQPAPEATAGTPARRPTLRPARRRAPRRYRRGKRPPPPAPTQPKVALGAYLRTRSPRGRGRARPLLARPRLPQRVSAPARPAPVSPALEPALPANDVGRRRSLYPAVTT